MKPEFGCPRACTYCHGWKEDIDIDECLSCWCESGQEQKNEMQMYDAAKLLDDYE